MPTCMQVHAVAQQNLQIALLTTHIIIKYPAECLHRVLAISYLYVMQVNMFYSKV